MWCVRFTSDGHDVSHHLPEDGSANASVGRGTEGTETERQIYCPLDLLQFLENKYGITRIQRGYQFMEKRRCKFDLQNIYDLIVVTIEAGFVVESEDDEFLTLRWTL